MQKEELPVDFILQMQSVLNEKEIPFFISALNHSDPVTGIRINKVKGKHLNISGNPVPWTLTGQPLKKDLHSHWILLFMRELITFRIQVPCWLTGWRGIYYKR